MYVKTTCPDVEKLKKKKMTNIFVWSSLLQPTTNYLEGAIVTVLPANATELYLSSVPFFYFKKIEIENNKIWFFNTYLIVLCMYHAQVAV